MSAPAACAQLATLTRLRVLYLHGCMPEGESLFSWEVLRPLTRIVFLAISQNRLEQLPPVVAGMAHLQVSASAPLLPRLRSSEQRTVSLRLAALALDGCPGEDKELPPGCCTSSLQALHCEQNALTSLPIGPYLFGLRELLLDWSTALQSPVALRAATQLSRLMLHAKFDVFDDEPNEEAYRPVPAGSGAALLDALASMPALRCVDDVFEGDSGQHVVTAEAASVMWQLGRRCPHLELGLPDSCNVGWTLATLVAELPHNAGGTRLA